NWNEIISAFREFKPTHVIHTAGDASGRLHFEDNLIYDAEVNVIGALNILRATLQVKAKKLVFASTAAVYGEVPEHSSADETYPLHTLSAYGASKASFELYLQATQALTSLQTVILRYANVYGPRQNAGARGGVVSIFARNL